MAKFRIVVEDAAKTDAFELKRYTETFERAGFSKTKAMMEAAKRAPKREKGFIHTEADDECPEGLPNCRNCGDPAFAESCKEQGHCPDCGTKHGIAPDSVVANHGFKLEKI